jgi:hypothetical protein
MGRLPTPFDIAAGEGSVNGQAASIPRATSFQQKVNESFAVLTARRSLLALSEVTRRCPEMLPMCFLPFAIYYSPFALSRK